MHISDVQKFLRCPRLYQYSVTDRTRSFPYFNININTTDSIIRKLQLQEYYQGVANEGNEETAAALEKYNWLVNARFVYRGLRVRIPFLYHEDRRCDVYFTSLSLNPLTTEAANISWSLSVLEKNGLEINKVYIIHLNRDYVREDELDDSVLWFCSSSFYNGNGHPTNDIMEYLQRHPFNIDIALDSMLHFDSDDDFEAVRSANCTGRNKCKYYDLCFPEEKNLPVDSILKLVGSQYKYEMYDTGIQYLSQADLLKLEGSRTQFAQIMADRSGGLYTDRLGLRSWLKENSEYPLSFVDFEWDLYAVPPYSGMKPLEVLPFQYSLHVMQEDGSIEHYEYIGDGDCRKEFLTRLLHDLPQEGTIFAYNAIGAEMLRLQTLKEEYPEFSEEVDNVLARMSDISIPFIKGTVYDIRMNGLYSLKVIQSFLDPDNSYDVLDIENGLEAVRIYRLLQNEGDEEKRVQYRKELFEYCGLDSYALVEAYNWLKEINTIELV